MHSEVIVQNATGDPRMIILMMTLNRMVTVTAFNGKSQPVVSALTKL